MRDLSARTASPAAWYENLFRRRVRERITKGYHTGPTPTAQAGTVAAYVSEGRWVADCGTEGCTGGMEVSRVYGFALCAHCAGGIQGGAWFTVAFPKDADEIEALLEVRPEANQNWLIGETIADLKRENAEHGMDRTGNDNDG